VFEGLSNLDLNIESYPLLKYFNIFFFSFRMPLFFIVSGAFFLASLRRKGANDYIQNRFSTLFYPLLIWGVLQITLQLAFAEYVNADREPMDYLRLLTDPRRIEQFWYLNALFFVSLLYTLLTVYGRFKPWHHLLVGAMLFGVAEFAFFSKVNIGFLFDLFFFYIFFAIGDLISDVLLNTRNYKILTSRWLFLGLLPVFILLQHSFTRINMDANDDYYVQYHLPMIYILCALVGGAFVICISFMLQKTDIMRWLRVIGYHSLFIYVMHLMVTSLTRTILVRFAGITNFPLLLFAGIMAGIVVPIVVYNVAIRYGGWWLFSLKKKTSSKMGSAAPYFKRDLLTARESTEVGKGNAVIVKRDDGKEE
jgi:fucose 4-O-acetylase-like acetyltransferase